jgi:hypothetical protein
MNPIFKNSRPNRSAPKMLLLAGLVGAVVAGSAQSSPAQCCSGWWGSCYQPTCWYQPTCCYRPTCCYQPTCCPSSCCSPCAAPACGASPCGVGGCGVGGCGVSYRIEPGFDMAVKVFRPQAIVITRWTTLHAAESRVTTNPVPRPNDRSTRSADAAAPPSSRRAWLGVSMSEVVTRS